MTGRALSLRDVGRNYAITGSVPALRNVSLDIAPGEYVSISGPSGGGKSTLLNILGLLDLADEGEYWIGDKEASALSPGEISALRASTFAFVFQSFHLLEYRPIEDSVDLGMLYGGASAAARRERANHALTQVGLAHKIGTVARHLSGGERQRVAVARALASGAPVILADEPTGNLDQASGKSVVALLEEANEAGATLIMVTHDEDIASRASRRLRIVDGRLSAKPPAGPSVMEPTKHEPGVARFTPRASLRDTIVDAWRTVTFRRWRTVGLAAAVALGVGLMVSTLGLSASAQTQVSDVFDAAKSLDVATEGPLINNRSDPEELVASLSAAEGVGSVAVVESRGTAVVQTGESTEAYKVPLVAGTGDIQAASRATIDWSSVAGVRSDSNAVLIGDLLAHSLDLGPLSLAPTILVDGARYPVAGIITEAPRTPDWRGAVLTNMSDVTTSESTVLLQAEPGATEYLSDRLAILVDPYVPEAFTTTVAWDPDKTRESIEGEVARMLAILTAVAMLAALAAVSHSTVVSIGDRKSEFGLRRAVGARSRDIVFVVASESAMTGFVGGAAGLIAGAAVILGVTIAQRWLPVFDPILGLSAIGVGTLVGVLGGAFASVRATRIRPHEALRS